MDMKKIEREVKEHGAELDLVSSGITADALPELDAAEERISGLAAELYLKPASLSAKTQKRLEELKRRISEIRGTIFDDLETDIEEKTDNLPEKESNYWAALLTLPVLSENWLRKIREYGIYNGLTVKEIVKKLKMQDSERIFEAISGPYGKGDNLNTALENIRKESARSKRYIVTETDSIVFGMAGDAAMAFAAVNGCKLLYSAVMDNRVCEECAELDGQIFDADDESLPHVPRHAKCRCMLVPVKE